MFETEALSFFNLSPEMRAKDKQSFKVTHPTVHGFHRTRSRHPHLVVKRFKATQRRMFYTFPRLPEATRFVQMLLLEKGRSSRGRLADSFLLFCHSRQVSLEKVAIFPAKALGNY